MHRWIVHDKIYNMDLENKIKLNLFHADFNGSLNS